MASTLHLRRELEAALPDRPFALELWDGTRLAATSPPLTTFRARSREAAAHVLRAPGQLGLGRAYVSGALEPDDLDAALVLLEEWRPPQIDRAARARLALAAARACGPMRPPPIPAAELRPHGRRHSIRRDARAVRHHYDLPPEFFALWLDDSMTYSCALFSRGAPTLEEAQRAKLEMVCRKLDLSPGERVLDVGCGWGSFAIHAAEQYGVNVVGITLSEPQAEFARRSVRERGLEGRVDIRVADYRELLDEPFDAVASIGMVEHVGSAQIDRYAHHLAGLLRPGGRALNHGIARMRHGEAEAGPFSERYVFPDGAPLHLSRIQFALEGAGLVTDHVEGLHGDYAVTLRHWAERLDERLGEAVRLAGPERVRVWRLYLRAARSGFLNGFTSIYQVRAHKPAG
ncbi:MAG TPA: cyclopropane-fatty-acyl-phospholipid synthase family protein [Thermoleophilaceae bacterium]|nr:cyclopropane-fatty-acyl-phospholipid synthase family protein [Thermoleophilaceae bacterium]